VIASLERRHHRRQRGASRLERQANATGAFRVCTYDRVDGPLLLVDDVRTTGATLNEARALLSAAYGVEVRTLAFTGVDRRC
jgi:predicted amidophosphoribosyltransferase